MSRVKIVTPKRKSPLGVATSKGAFHLVGLTVIVVPVKPLATATTAASGGNREELLGPRPAGCKRQRSRRWEPQPGLLLVISILHPLSSYKAVPVFSLLRHIGDAPVHWHEETFSSGGILLSDENATVFLTSSDLQPVAPTQIATLNAICFFFNRIKIFQASIP